MSSDQYFVAKMQLFAFFVARPQEIFPKVKEGSLKNYLDMNVWEFWHIQESFWNCSKLLRNLRNPKETSARKNGQLRNWITTIDEGLIHGERNHWIESYDNVWHVTCVTQHDGNVHIKLQCHSISSPNIFDRFTSHQVALCHVSS